jgi:hypothetical protein
MHLSQPIINLMMILVHVLELAVVFLHMIQGKVREVGFRLGVALQQSLDDAGHRHHLHWGGEAGQNALDLIEYAQEYGMLCNQGFCNLHVMHHPN